MNVLHARLPLAVAIGALVLAAGASGQPNPHAMPGHAPAAAAMVVAATGAVATPAPAPVGVKRYELHTNIVDGKMVFIDDKAQVNPTLQARVGDTLEIVLESGEGAEHDFVAPDLGIASPKFSASTGKVTVRVKVDKPGTFSYWCSIPGHRQIGMEGKLEITGDAIAAAPASGESSRSALAIYTPAPVPQRAVDPAAVSVAADPAAVPAPVGARAPTNLKYRMETVELPGKLDDGTTFTYWTFDRKVPGPMLRARVGDTIELTLANARDSKMIHSIDLHAVTGGHGGGEHTQVAPGQEKTITFKALNPGLYVYHCATPLVPQHIAAGMYGMILVEPEGGLPKVDREYYVMQGDMYTARPNGAKGHQERA